MKSSFLIFISFGFAFTLLTFTFERSSFCSVESPEKEALRIAKYLKPIGNKEWQSIAGQRITEKYNIERGDTLYDISKRLFGDSKYWPKIWALNNGFIFNPHHIRPGKLIAFMPGTGNSLPGVSLGESPSSDLGGSGKSGKSGKIRKKFAYNSVKNSGDSSEEVSDARDYSDRGASNDWKYLPPQNWETIKVVTPPQVDPTGFDRRSKISFGKKSKIELDGIVESETIPELGSISAAHADGAGLTLRNEVYVTPANGGAIQVGGIYAISQEPNVLNVSGASTAGYVYPILGKVQIVGEKDGLYIGDILSSQDVATRGSTLIPAPPTFQLVDPVPGPSPLKGILSTETRFSPKTTAQFKEVYIDLGNDDGVKPGMVFRIYRHDDPSNQNRITDADVLEEADIEVVQTSSHYCAGIVITGEGTIQNESEVVLLTDVSQLRFHKGKKDTNVGDSNTPPIPAPTDEPMPVLVPSPSPKPLPLPSVAPVPSPVPSPAPNPSPSAAAPTAVIPFPPQPDNLDQLDDGQGLDKNGERTLKQLEKWKGNPSPTPTPSQPPVETKKEDELPPPPSDTNEPPASANPEPAPETAPPAEMENNAPPSEPSSENPLPSQPSNADSKALDEMIK